jgi:hypothetical protein
MEWSKEGCEKLLDIAEEFLAKAKAIISDTEA